MPPLILKGVVTKAGVMRKTVTVTVTRMVEHPRTHKAIASSKKYLTHDPKDELRLNDECLIQNCPPVSARKKFSLLSIVKRARTSDTATKVDQPATMDAASAPIRS
ncbi:30S ribosomal protein S17 OS=Thermus thermophilus (strain HB8 / ATCC 27634 / DSM 579) GN=rpsQ PE=1 SV=3 [Rhizoctonia solani AG-1 IB]|uniref:30S ribosomal protein S17 n=1 Tax=Thanatephorus cucumeris (strain AG1-IB / isolate 7/3/14) TaxID=1108050 RepID=A0A0B7FSA2_THACB|nr:30S ribosomal protein S17 OS=Thermus thermophilus (strain HB8 / ATCC 27634 / DSM 579) GN=rpsQ PE=1 SV=3 [Rhizoctonia solani AG-1 IB]